MSLRRIVMRNHARRIADQYRAATQLNRTPGMRRNKRILMRAEFEDLGTPSTRDGRLRVYGERLDFFKDRAYGFLMPSKAHVAARKLLGLPSKKNWFHRPWAGSWC